ncbi:MAG TPA: hypothetical protein VK961_06915 [Chthoniobacter sp.]|nr:hypothetical protein [Chthoniobacter sp.]
MNAAQRMMLFKLWQEAWKIFRRQGVPAKENDQRRRDATRQAFGYDRSWKENWTESEVDKMKAHLLALTQPADMTAQMEQLNQSRRRHRWVIDQQCGKLGKPHAYAEAIAARMNQEGRIGSASIDELGTEDLEKIIVALKLQVKRAKATKASQAVRELSPAGVAIIEASHAPDPNWDV